MLTKQAKILTDAQIKAVLSYLETSRNASRNRVMFLLSLSGLRSKEISELKMTMITDVDGKLAESISLHNSASKGRSGRIIYMSKALRRALEDYLPERRFPTSEYVITTERSPKFSAHAVVVFFSRLYKSLGFEGASSHSGRRHFITNCARKISLAGGSLRDVQLLAGHSSLATTQRYIDYDTEAQRKVIEMAFKNVA